jgi:hypothetical protein
MQWIGSSLFQYSMVVDVETTWFILAITGSYDFDFGYLYNSHDSIDGNSRYLDPHTRVDSEDDSDSLDGF